MEYRQLGSSGVKVSALCLGTMNFGVRTPEPDAHQIIDSAIDGGINFIDTANQYGGEMGVGATEAILGRWFADNKAKRDRLVIATKVYEPMSDDINDRGLSARHIQMACDASLKRLCIDHIDLYQMHHFDRNVRDEEIWLAMDRLIAQGKITYVGSSNFPGWAIARTNEKARTAGRMGLVTEQSIYNLVERSIELEVLPACREYGVGLIPWSPLAGGLLAGSSPRKNGRRDHAEMRQEQKTRAEQLKKYSEFCGDFSQTESNIALSWLLHRQGVVSTIIGPGDVGQLGDVLDAPGIRLSTDDLAALDEIFPPTGPAPEAYAW